MNLEELRQATSRIGLEILGAFHPGIDDDLEGIETLLLLGPQEPGFWALFTASSEYRDGQPDPLDRWSRRMITALAGDIGGASYFPFDGPPYYPFIRWALSSGRAFVSPVGLLVHNTAGLMVSYRGAIGLAARLELPGTPRNPCDDCRDRPCLAACPAGALGAETYDVTACRADLARYGNDCMARGCAVRRICPVSRGAGRLEAQTVFHMEAFR